MGPRRTPTSICSSTTSASTSARRRSIVRPGCASSMGASASGIRWRPSTPGAATRTVPACCDRLRRSPRWNSWSTPSTACRARSASCWPNCVIRTPRVLRWNSGSPSSSSSSRTARVTTCGDTASRCAALRKLSESAATQKTRRVSRWLDKWNSRKKAVFSIPYLRILKATVFHCRRTHHGTYFPSHQADLTVSR